MCQFHRIMKSVTICKALRHFTFFLFFFFFFLNCIYVFDQLFIWRGNNLYFPFLLFFAILEPWKIVFTFQKEEESRGRMVIRQILVENKYFALLWQRWPLFLLFDYSYHHVDAIITCVDMVLYLFNTYLASQQECELLIRRANSSFFPLFLNYFFLNELMHI